MQLFEGFGDNTCWYSDYFWFCTLITPGDVQGAMCGARDLNESQTHVRHVLSSMHKACAATWAPDSNSCAYSVLQCCVTIVIKVFDRTLELKEQGKFSNFELYPLPQGSYSIIM